MSKKVLVTGGLGFIGFQLCKQLLNDDSSIDLTIVDNLSSTKLNYNELIGRARIEIKDLRSFDEHTQTFDDIYHLASPVGSVGILEKHGHIATDILELANKAAQLARASQARLLYLSSSEVYGRDGQHAESTELVVPDKRGARMEYSLGKLTAEHTLFNLAMDEQFDVRIVRPFNVAGEWQSAMLGFVLPKFFEAALSGKPLQVYGTGQQRRSFCHVSDLAKGVIAVQQQAPGNTIYNVGNPSNVTTITELAHRIHTLCQSTSAIDYVDPYQLHGKRFMEAFDKIPDITRLTTNSTWQPVKSLEDTLARVLGFYQSRHPSTARSHNAVTA